MSSENNSSSPEEEYEVEDIIDSRIIPVYDHNKKKYYDVKEYEIKWVGYDLTSWEPESNLEHCQEILANFKKRHEIKEKNNKKAKNYISQKSFISSNSEIECLTSFKKDFDDSRSCRKYNSENTRQKTNPKRKKAKKIPKVNKNKTKNKVNSLNKLNSPLEIKNIKKSMFTMALSEETKITNNLSLSDDDDKEKRKNFQINMDTKNTPYIAYKDIANLSSFKNLGPSFEEVFYFDARPNKITLHKKEEFNAKKGIKNMKYYFENPSVESNLKKGGKINDDIINNYKMNTGSEIESLEIVNVIKPNTKENKNYSVEAIFDIKENPMREINYLNKVGGEELKDFYKDIFKQNFKGKVLKYNKLFYK